MILLTVTADKISGFFIALTAKVIYGILGKL